jgi:hypothetical protein
MLRRYGWGVPDLGRAVMSATNDATLMVEDALFPFRQDGSIINTAARHASHSLRFAVNRSLENLR